MSYCSGCARTEAQLATVTAENERLRRDLDAIRSGVPTQVMSAATDALATARSEGWCAGVDAAVRLLRETAGQFRSDGWRVLADEHERSAARLASLTETKGKEP